jgi:Tfp pilus assembly protein FimT
MIAAILILIAVPSISGMLADQRLHESYNRFGEFAGKAKLESLRDQKPITLVWDKQGIAMCKPERDSHGDLVVAERMDVPENEKFDLNRPAALVPQPAAEWTFWPNGTCEPVIVTFKGPAGHWQASFDALTGRGTFLNSETM